MVDLAPDGKRLAVHVADVRDYVWIYDIERRVGRRVPSANPNGWPVWSPDGRRLAVQTKGTYKEPLTVFLIDPDGSASPGQKVESPFSGFLDSWSRNDVLALDYGEPLRVGFVSLKNPIEAPGFEGNFFTFSPDGRWIAYSSQQTGSEETYIRSFPDGKVARQFSVDGGLEPLWLDSGELFYRKGSSWMSSRVSTSPELRWDPPRLAFETEFLDTPGRSYDVSPDGQRLLVVKRTQQVSQSRINLIVNWQQSVKPAN